MIKDRNSFTGFGGETDTMDRLALLQTADRGTDFGDLFDLRPGESSFDKDPVLVFGITSGIKEMRFVAGDVFEKIVCGIESALLDRGPRGVDKLGTHSFRHVKVEGLEDAAVEKARGEI